MKKAGLFFMCGLLVLSLNMGCGKKDEKPKNDSQKEEIIKKELTKEEITQIEKTYYDSELVLKIEGRTSISSGVVISLPTENPEMVENKIFEFVNSKGEIQKGAVIAVESVLDSIGALLHSVDDDIKFSSIIFKRKKYNGKDWHY